MNLTATQEQIAAFERRIRELIAEGYSTIFSVYQAYREHPVMQALYRETLAAIRAEAERGYGAPLPQGITARLFTHVWAPDGLRLSTRTTRGAILVREMVARTIEEQLAKSASYRETSLAIFDGYKKGGVIPTQDIPKYLNETITVARHVGIPRDEMMKLLNPVRRQIVKGTTAGMRAAYSQLVDALETQNEKALSKAIYVATQERTRYFADRIARTEMARAYQDGFLLKWDNNEDCVAYQWKLSGRHPRYDICDLYAKANLYGMGAGVFPKDKVPLLPAHPHCMCFLKPVIRGMLDNETPHERIEEGGREYLAGVSLHHQQMLLGVHGAKDVVKGEISWTQKARGYSGAKLKGRFQVDSKGRIVYNKIIERDGRRASVYVRSDGSIVLTEKHDLNESYSPSMRGKSNGVILYGSPAGNGTRQANIAIFDENGNGVVALHYGSHTTPNHHSFGKMVDGHRTGFHAHDIKINDQSPRPYEPREMSEEEEKYLRR